MAEPEDPAKPGSVAPPEPRAPALPEDYAEDRDTVFALLGSVSRSGNWEPPEQIEAIASLGSVQLDFRKADLPAGVTEIRATAILGSVQVRSV